MAPKTKKKKAKQDENFPEIDENNENIQENLDNDLEDVIDKKALKAQKKEEKRRAKEEKKANKRQGNGGKAKKIIPIVIIAVLLAAIVSILGFNAFGIRDKYLKDFMSDIPVLKNLVNSDSDDEGSNVSSSYTDVDTDGLLLEIENLKTQIALLEEENAIYVEEITRLREIEDMQLDVVAQREAFEAMIASNDPDAFANFFEEVRPELAERYYKENLEQKEATKELKNYIQTYTSMDEKDAAKIFEEMMGTDIEQIVLILKNMDPESRANILGNMTPASAATLTKRLSPNLQKQ